MSYVHSHLLDQEHVIYHTKKHWVVFLPSLFWLMLTVFCYTLAFSGLILSYVTGFAFVVTFLYALIEYAMSEFAVTNRRLILKEGFIWRKSIETMIRSVASIEVNQSLLGGILGYGEIKMNGFGGSDLFKNICAPLKFRHYVQEEIARTRGYQAQL